MDQHDQLHRTLRSAAKLLDSAAHQIRELGLAPTRENIRHIGEALGLVFQVQHSVEVCRPDLKKQYPEPTQEERLANKRLGEALIEAEELSEKAGSAEAQAFLEGFAKQEPSTFHRDIAILEATRYKLRNGT